MTTPSPTEQAPVPVEQLVGVLGSDWTNGLDSVSHVRAQRARVEPRDWCTHCRVHAVENIALCPVCLDQAVQDRETQLRMASTCRG